MNIRAVVIALVVITITLGYIAWQRSSKSAQPQAPQSGSTTEAPAMPGMPGMSAPTEDAGVAWNDPNGWTKEAGHGMRLATYTISGSGGEATCPVFYFGPGQGGGVEANVQRWISEFSDESKPERKMETLGGMTVARVQIKGNYLSHGAMSGSGASDAEHDNYMLLGAIVEGPNGMIFFKFTGPQKTVEAQQKAFDSMLASLHKK